MTRDAQNPKDEPRGGLSRRSVLGGAAAGMAAGLAGSAAVPASAAPPPPRSAGFVTVKGRNFMVGGKVFRFGGTNCYYLHQSSHYMIDAVLNDAAVMGLSVVRAEAFADGTGDRALQPSPYVYDEDNFDDLDYAVWKAGQLGLRLVVVLANNWPDYGGMQQYVKWFLGLADDSYGDGVNHDKFYTDSKIRACYRAYAKHVITRTNRYTHLRYNEDPTIMTFELANEPRNRSDKTGAGVLAWAGEMSAWVSSLAPRQLVAVGDEGFYGIKGNADYPYSDYEGNKWKKLCALPHVDYATFHLYPQGWGETSASKPGTNPVTWGTQWINDHLADGKTLGKPVVLEEFGLAIDAAKDVPDTAARDAGYTAWTGAIEAGVGSDQFWLLTSRVEDGSFYPDYDGYRVIWRNDSDNPGNSTAHLLSDHAKRMAGA